MPGSEYCDFINYSIPFYRLFAGYSERSKCAYSRKNSGCEWRNLNCFSVTIDQVCQRITRQRDHNGDERILHGLVTPLL